MVFVNFFKYSCYHYNLKYHVLDMRSWGNFEKERDRWGYKDIQKTWRGKERARICMIDHSDNHTGAEEKKTKGNGKKKGRM